MAETVGGFAPGQHGAPQPQQCTDAGTPSGAAAATGGTDFTHFSAAPEASRYRSPSHSAAAEAAAAQGLEVPIAMMSWTSSDTTSDQDVTAIVKTLSTGIRKVAAALPPVDPVSNGLPPDMGSGTFERIMDPSQVAVPVSTGGKSEVADDSHNLEPGAAVAVKPVSSTPRRTVALPPGSHGDSSRAGLGLPPLGSRPLSTSLAHLAGRSPKASSISVTTSDDVNRRTEAARRASEAKALLGAAETQPLKQSMLLRGSADAVTVAFGGITTGAGGHTHNDPGLAGRQCNPGVYLSGAQLSPRGSTVTTSLPFAPGFGGIGPIRGRGTRSTSGDPDYTPPTNSRPTTRAASRRRGRDAVSAQRLPSFDEDFTDEDDVDFDDPGSCRGGPKKVGRPITFKGDINNPNLTNEERRRIKRRVANRESAQRVRHKRQVQLEELQAKVTALLAQNVELKGALAEADAARTLLAAQVEGLRARWSGNTQRAALLQARASAITAAQQHQQHQLQHQQAPLPKVVLSTAPMVPEPSTEVMAGVSSPFAAAASAAAAAASVCDLPPLPDLDTIMQPEATITTKAPTFCDTLPFAEELAAVAAQLTVPLPQLGVDRSTSPLLAAAGSLDLPPCSQTVLGGGEGSAFHAVGPVQTKNGVTVTRTLSWSLDAAGALTPALSPDTEDAAARVSPQPWGLYRHGTAVGAC